MKYNINSCLRRFTQLNTPENMSSVSASNAESFQSQVIKSTNFIAAHGNNIDIEICSSLAAKWVANKIDFSRFGAIIESVAKACPEAMYRSITSEPEASAIFWNSVLEACNSAAPESNGKYVQKTFSVAAKKFVSDYVDAQNGKSNQVTDKALNDMSPWMRKALAPPVPENPHEWLAAKIAEAHAAIEKTLVNPDGNERSYGSAIVDNDEHEYPPTDSLKHLQLKLRISVASWVVVKNSKEVAKETDWPDQLRVCATLLENKSVDFVTKAVEQRSAADFKRLTAIWEDYVANNPENPNVKKYLAEQKFSKIDESVAKSTKVAEKVVEKVPSSDWCDEDVEEQERRSKAEANLSTVLAEFGYMFNGVTNCQVLTNFKDQLPFDPFTQPFNSENTICDEEFYANVTNESYLQNAFGCIRLFDSRDTCNVQQLTYMSRMVIYIIKCAFHELIRIYVSQSPEVRSNQPLYTFDFPKIAADMLRSFEKSPQFSRDNKLVHFFAKAYVASSDGSEDGLFLDFHAIAGLCIAAKSNKDGLFSYCPSMQVMQHFTIPKFSINRALGAQWLPILLVNLLRAQQVDDSKLRDMPNGVKVAILESEVGDRYFAGQLDDYPGNFITRLFSYTAEDSGVKPAYVPQEVAPHGNKLGNFKKNKIADHVNSALRGNKGYPPRKGKQPMMSSRNSDVQSSHSGDSYSE